MSTKQMGSLNPLHGKLKLRFIACIFILCGILGLITYKNYCSGAIVHHQEEDGFCWGEDTCKGLCWIEDAKKAAKHSKAGGCMNYDGGGGGGGSSGGGDGGDDSCSSNEQNSYPSSYVDNISLNYHHWSNDYQVTQQPGGCASCGRAAPSVSSPGMDLLIQRRHRYRDQSWQSSFGPGVFLNYDTQLNFHRSTPNQEIQVFIPQKMNPLRVVDGQPGDPTGTFRDVRTNRIKQVCLTDSQGKPTKHYDLATTAELINHDGGIRRFEIINVSGGATPTTPAAGHNGVSALQFDGIQDYIAIGHSTNLDFAGAISLSVWIKPDVTNPNATMQYIVSYSTGAIATQEVFLRINKQ